MDALANATELAMFPPNFISALQNQAQSDAVAAVEFVRSSVRASTGTDVGIDVDQFDLKVLIGFALVVRFRRWEHDHIRVHLDAGLPSSEEVLARMLKLGNGSKLNEFVASAMVASAQVFYESFLWSADDCDLRLDLAILAEEDERFLDAVADFLLEHAQK